MRLAQALTLVTGRADGASFKVGLEAIESGVGRLLPTAPTDFEGTGIAFRSGDLLFGKLRPYLAKAWLADREGAAVGDFLVLRPTKISDAKFLNYVLLSKTFLEPITAAVTGAKMPRTDWSTVKNSIIYLPSLDEQRAIADYLDQETARIDVLVAKQEELIGLLWERRLGVREKLADRVAIGARLRWILREVDERARSRAPDLPLFSVSISWGVRRRDETTDKLSRAEDLSRYKVCSKGDIIVNRMRAFQGALGVAPSGGIVSPDYAVLRPVPDVDPQWLAELMQTKAFVSEIVLRLRGIGSTDSGNVRTPRINTDDLLDIRSGIPAMATQRAELGDIVNKTNHVDELIAKAREHTVLAKERRSALITAAVTSQFDVRTAQRGA